MDVQIGKSLPPAEETLKGKSNRNLLKRNASGTHLIGGGKEKVLPEGITSKEAYITRQMAKHPDVVEKNGRFFYVLCSNIHCEIG